MEKELNSFSRGLRDGIPICLGYLSVAFAFGIFTVGHGLTIWEAVMILSLIHISEPTRPY